MQPTIIRNLSITTKVRLNPDFFDNPIKYAKEHGVELVDDVYPETQFKAAPDGTDGEKLRSTKSNIHLVRHGAIRLFSGVSDVVTDDVVIHGENYLQTIDVNLPVLLFGKKMHLLSQLDVARALTTVVDLVLPLLANPDDARHLIPGLHQQEDPVAFWRLVDCEVLLPGVPIRCLHHLSHPKTGPAKGCKAKRIQLGDRRDSFMIRVKELKHKCDEVEDWEDQQGARVRLILKGKKLLKEMGRWNKAIRIDKTPRVGAFSHSSITALMRSVMSRLEGTCLPVPPEWENPSGNKAVTHAKAIALVSQLTNLDPAVIQAMDQEIREPSPSTRKRFKKDFAVESSLLNPLPLAQLFNPVLPPAEMVAPSLREGRLDPEIARLYG